MAETNPLRKLLDSSPNLELWWDSSPLEYEEWIKGKGKSCREMGLFQVNNEGAGYQFLGDSLLQGSTTNQPLTWKVIERDTERWKVWQNASAACTRSHQSRGFCRNPPRASTGDIPLLVGGDQGVR